MAGSDDRSIARYAELAPDHFGGVFMRDGRHVVLFTQDLPRHEMALREHLDPDDFTVAHAHRSWREVMNAKDEVAHALLHSRGGLGVNAVGIGLEDDQFVIGVFMTRVDEALVAEVRRAAAPHRLVIRQEGLIRPA